MSVFFTPIEYLKGVGPTRAQLLKKELNIFTYQDLISYYPFRYIDRTKIHKANEITDDMPFIQLKGKIMNFVEQGKGTQKRLIGSFDDGSGSIELVWFKGISWIKKGIKINQLYLV